MSIIFKPGNSFSQLKIRGRANKSLQPLNLFIFLLLISSCITEFIPEIHEDNELLVVEGLITDQPETNTIKLSKSLALGLKSDAKPMSGCFVTISDDLGNRISLTETVAGTYVTPPFFQGVIGRSYTLHVTTNFASNNLNYESYPMEMKPVPPIDSIYYEKTVIEPKYENFAGIDGCQIYLDTHDSGNKCRFFRFDYAETWVLRLLFPVDNMKCWVSEKSNAIIIKSTAALKETQINHYPINYISNSSDRLKRKYSILVNQYSLNEDEYNFWEKLQNLTVQVGGLYDVIPYSIPSNLLCIENPNEKVLGYFSVSAKSSKRIFIEDNFSGIIDQYADCISDTIPTDDANSIPNLNISVWVLLVHKHTFNSPGYTLITKSKGCADCTVRGTTKKPDFWIGD
jgi:hypothetical protein